jgi:carboxymethylenebutenolidase
MQTQWLTLHTSDGPMRAYYAAPDGAGPGPGVVVLQEAFGVNRYVRSVCDRLADAGFAAIAPELFHRTGAHVELAYTDMEKVMTLLKALTLPQVEEDCGAAVAALRARVEVDPKRLGVVGFCFGGYAAVLTGLTTAVAAVVAFYPGGLCEARPGRQTPPLLDRIPQLRAATLMNFGEADQGITPANVSAIKAALEQSPAQHRVNVYPGAKHGFHSDDRADAFHPQAAEDAWHATLGWLRDMLR